MKFIVDIKLGGVVKSSKVSKIIVMFWYNWDICILNVKYKSYLERRNIFSSDVRGCKEEIGNSNLFAFTLGII